MPSMDEHVRLRQEAVRARPDLLKGIVEMPPGIDNRELPAEDGWTGPVPPGRTSPLVGYAVLPLEAAPYRTGYPDSEPILLDEYRNLPDRFVGALDALCLVEFDNARCARCGDSVGYRVHGDADEFTEWTFTALVDSAPRQSADGAELVQDPVTWQCEACAPDTAPENWPSSKPPDMWWPRDLTACATAPGGARRVHVTTPGGTACQCGETQPRMRPQVAGQ